MQPKFDIIDNITNDILKYDITNALPLYINVFDDAKHNLSYYRNRLQQLMTTTNNNNDQHFNYDDYDMFSIIDAYASWSCYLSDLQIMLQLPYNIPNLFSDYKDPRC